MAGSQFRHLMSSAKEESSSGTADPLGLSILKDSTVAQKTHSH